MIEISLAGAFLGGVLSLLSPCSALLLPAFFAYAFQSRRELVARTFVFFLGLCTLLIPLGMGAGFAASIVLDYREQTIIAAGVLLIGFGLLELSGKGFSILPQRLAGAVGGGKGWLSVYSTGLVYGFSGFCAGPLLGAVLTVAASTGSATSGGLLLLAYSLGMVMPLLLLSALWDRYQLGSKPWLRGKVITIGRYSVHSFSLIAGLLFIGMGLLFISTGGTLALEGWYETVGLVTLSYRLQETVTAATRGAYNWLWIGLITGLLALLIRQGLRRV